MRQELDRKIARPLYEQYLAGRTMQAKLLLSIIDLIYRKRELESETASEAIFQHSQ